ncbi:interleukin-6 receptor subunit beta [Melanotaenia boesemani]|uniref:interleukin-6 receptor subunit beta n=1 Tax=Melanotaenia boesemani TaxID=1250792 RepID=UPI001C05E0E6|nr:interleukin-6 receptor subunit beta [Melanotaenia boesemani]
MEQRQVLLWTCLLGAGLALVQPPAFPVTTFKAHPRPPRLIGCVFIIRSNVTCRWEPVNIPATQYTLRVQRIPGVLLGITGKYSMAANSSLETFTCTTTGTSCTIGIPTLKVRIYFCISIRAQGGSFNILSEPRCQPGRKEVVLPPVILDNVKQVLGSPQCLNVSWRRSLSVFPVSDSEIEDGDLNSQIQFHTQTQLDVHVHNVTVTGPSVLVCLFKPDTTYIIRLRNRYQGPASPWSSWSNPLQGKTSEDAPSAAPIFWRQVKHTDGNEWRLVSLLWKPLPHYLANGRVLFYNVTCQRENAQPLIDYGNCRDLHYPSTSCSFPLPASRCSCTITASTSAGMSPEARIWFLGTTETELPPPSHVIAWPLDDSSLEVHWTSPRNRSVSGFVVEWFAVREKTSSILHWEKLNSSYTKLVIAEGVNPMECYAVSVKMLYGEQGAGKDRMLHIYTKQGTPSAGPNVTVQHISGGKVELSWSPVPVELLHGFLCNYTLFYTTRNQTAKRVCVPGHVHRYTLVDLSPGNYDIFMRAKTVAGPGPAGTLVNVHIGSEEISLMLSVVVPVMMSFLVLMACVVQMKMIKQKLFQEVPNPSNSSLSHWTHETNLKSKKVIQEKPDIKYSEVILLDKVQDLEDDHGYQRVHGQTYFIQHFSSLPGRNLGKALTRNETEETSVTDLSTSPCIYSDILHSQTLTYLPTPLLSSSNLHPSDCEPRTTCSNNIMLQPTRDGELSYLHPPDEEKSCFLLEHLQSFVSSDSGGSSHLSVLFSHQNEVSRLNSALPLQPNTTYQPQAPFEIFPKTFSLFPHSGFVNFTYSSVQCDPYIPSDV